MIPDEVLKEAAAKSQEAFVKSFEEDYDAGHQHKFSIKFEKKIHRLKRKANHPILYRAVQRAAVILLAMLIGGSTWLAVDVDARATFFGWIKEVYEEYFVYRFSDDVISNSEAGNYEPAWIPEGYSKKDEIDTGGLIAIFYENDQRQLLKLHYIYEPSEINMFIDMSEGEVSTCYIGDYVADLILVNEPNTANAIMWTDEKGCAFYISAFLDRDELVRMANSIYSN